MLDAIFKVPILGNPFIWIILFCVVLYVWHEIAEHREDRAWEKLQHERWARIRNGEILKPLPPYVDSSGRTHVDVASCFQYSEHDCSVVARITRSQL